MKNKLLIEAIIFSLIIVLLIGMLDTYEFSKANNNNIVGVPRRYIDLGRWHNFNEFRKANFYTSIGFLDLVFLQIFDFLIIIQSFFIIRKIKVKNSFLIIGWLISSVVGGFLVFLPITYRNSLLAGVNPSFMYIPIFFLLVQIVIWMYLNLLLFIK